MSLRSKPTKGREPSTSKELGLDLNAMSLGHEDPPPSYQTATSSSQRDNVSTPSSVASSDLLDEKDVNGLERGIDATTAPSRTTSNFARLRRPIAIPQLDFVGKLKQALPFTRAYAPVLSDYSLTPEDFLRIVDTINVCIAANPAFQAMHLAAFGVGVAPDPSGGGLFMGISTGLDIAAGVGSGVAKYYRLKAFSEKINKQVWEPRGLEMKVIKDKALLQMLGIEEKDLPKAAEDAPTPAKLSQKRLKQYEGRIQEVDFNVPEPEQAANIMDRLSARQQAKQEQKREKKASEKRAKQERKNQKRGKKAEHTVRSSSDSDSDSSDRSDSSEESEDEMQKATERADRKAEKINAKSEEKLAEKNLSDRERRKIEREREKKLDEVERDWEKMMAKIERERSKNAHKLDRKVEKCERKDPKRERKHQKRSQKELGRSRKKLDQTEWIVVANAGDLPAKT